MWENNDLNKINKVIQNKVPVMCFVRVLSYETSSPLMPAFYYLYDLSIQTICVGFLQEGDIDVDLDIPNLDLEAVPNMEDHFCLAVNLETKQN